MLLAFQKGMQQGIEQGNGKAKPENIFNADTRKRLNKKSLEHAALAVGTTKDELQKAIDKATKEGTGTQGLAKLIRDQFEVDSRHRSLVIARTELTDTINQGVVETFEEEGTTEKQWSTVTDGQERDSHAAADGQTVGLDEDFTVGGERAAYPGDPSLSPESRCNCRCTLVAGGISKERQMHINQQFLRAHGVLENRFVVQLRKSFLDQRDRILSRL